MTEPPPTESPVEETHPRHDATSDAASAAPHESVELDDAALRAAVRRLDELGDLPTAEHVEVYETVHASLQESLAEASRQADESPDDGHPPS